MAALHSVDVIWLTEGKPVPTWGLGRAVAVRPEVGVLAAAVGDLVKSSQAEAVLFWDTSLGAADQRLVGELLNSQVDCWHAGLRLGTDGLPGILDFISPTWMLACDPPPEIEATSWRLSFCACLVRMDVLRKLGGPRPEFQSLEAAALEMGHRWIRRGALVRHVPGLLPRGAKLEDGRSKIAGGREKMEDGRSKIAGSSPISDLSSPISHPPFGPISHLPSPISYLPSPISHLPFADELRFAYYRFGRKWAAWAVFRALMTRYVGVGTAMSAWREAMASPRLPEPAPLRDIEVQGSRFKVQGSKFEAQSLKFAPAERSPALRSLTSDLRPLTSVTPPSSVLRPPSSGPDLQPSAFSLQPSSEGPVVSAPISHLPSPISYAHRVSVLIPTLDRYPYLRTLLGQLREQTVPPLEIIIVDQTARERRQETLDKEFSNLPLKVIFQDEPGQCTSRNAGLQMARGEYILFIDDDDEVQPDLVERHLQTLALFGAEVSCGVADEVGAGPLPPDFRLLRASDVFPTNNTLVRRDVLRRSGLFDLAYNRRQRADGDLGMRVYLSGALMVLNPAISVLHHHAPSGGLRKHKARTVTYAMSRSEVFRRMLSSASEIYLAGRYFPARHQREMLWQSALGTFSVRGGVPKRLAKALVSAAFLPQSITRLRTRARQAREMARVFPQIPRLDPARSVELRCTEAPVAAL